MSLLREIKNQGMIAVIRGANKSNILPITSALHRAGARVLEITVETPNALGLIEMVNEEFEEELVVGAGTVLDPETARSAIFAGAKFIFSPTVNRETIQLTKRYGVISIPGALTPTEILTAYESGADIVKVFPARTVGPTFIKDLRGPLPHIPLMPTGGVTLENVQEYIRAGSIAVGIGRSLVNTKKLANDEDYLLVEKKAKEFLHLIQIAKNNQNLIEKEV